MEVRPVSSERASVFTGGLLVPDRLRSLTSNSFNLLDSIVIAFVLFFLTLAGEGILQGGSTRSEGPSMRRQSHHVITY